MASIAALGLSLEAPLPDGPEGTAEAARRFEALLLEQLLAPLSQKRDDVPAWVDGGAAGQLARELHVAELARIAADRGVLGLETLLARPGGGAGEGS